MSRAVWTYVHATQGGSLCRLEYRPKTGTVSILIHRSYRELLKWTDEPVKTAWRRLYESELVNEEWLHDARVALQELAGRR